MAINEDLKKKIAERLKARTPEQKQLSRQLTKDESIRERIRLVKNKSDKSQTPKAPVPKKDLTTRIAFTDVRAPLGKDNLLGSFARFSYDVFTAFAESTGMGLARSASQIKKAITGEEIKVPGLKVTTDLSFGGNNLETIQNRIPTFSEAAILRQDQLDKQRPDYPWLNTIQAASEEIFLPLWDAVPVIGAATHTMFNAARKAVIKPAAKQAFETIGVKISADKAITESSIRSSVKNTVRRNINDLNTGKITPEEFLFKQTEIGNAVDVLNEGQTRFGRLGSAVNKLSNSLAQERSLRGAKVVTTADGVPVISRAVDESFEMTESLLKEQNKALRGEMEDMRLSNARVLADAIKDSDLADDITADSHINVFTIGNRRLKPGTRVSLDRESARNIIGNAPRTVGVNVDDLVKLPNGDFVYAPKSMLGTETDALSTVRKSFREEKMKREAFTKAEERVRETIEKTKRLETEQEAARLIKEDEARIARETARRSEAEKTIKEAPINVAQRKSEIDVETANQIAKIQAQANVAKAELKSATDNLKTLGKKVKVAEKKVATIQKAIAKAKKQGRATVRLNQALSKAKSELVQANKSQRAAQTTAKKAKSNVPTDTKVKAAELKASADIKKAKIVEESKKAVAEARAIIKELTTTNKVPSTRQADRLQAKIDKLEGKKAKLIEAYGRIEEVPVEKIKVIDDAIAELGKVETSVEKVGGDSTAVATTKAPVKVTETTPAKIKPVKIEGTDVQVSTLAKRLSNGLDDMPDVPEFNVATHAKQAENALNHIAKHGIDDTISMIEKGSFPEGTTKASMVSSLMESIDAVTDPALKLNYTNRLAAYIPELSDFATRAGQEIEALKILHKDNPIMKIMRIQKDLNSKKNIKRTAAEVAKLEKQLSKVDTKGIIKEAIDKATC